MKKFTKEDLETLLQGMSAVCSECSEGYSKCSSCEFHKMTTRLENEYEKMTGEKYI